MAVHKHPSKNSIVGATDGTLIGNIGDALKTSSIAVAGNDSDFFYRIARGDFGLARWAWAVNGHTPSLATAGADISSIDANYITWPSGAATLSIVSDEAVDDIAGTGARTIRIYGLDANHDWQFEDLEMDGETPVVTSNTYLRFNMAIITTAGSGNKNAGEITITHGSDILGLILVGDSITKGSNFTIPNGYIGYVVKGTFSFSKASAIKGIFKAHPYGAAEYSPFVFNTSSSLYKEDFFLPFPTSAKSDLWVWAEPGVQGFEASCFYQVILEATT